ncbi:hypothetical protein H0H93_015019, partial [Arthromyces matolae]
TLDSIPGNEPLDCLSVFRHLMVDVVVAFSYGYRLGAVSKWAVNVEDPLSTAINDFPKRGILVRSPISLPRSLSRSGPSALHCS